MELLQKLSRQLAREFYAAPETYGPRLPPYIRKRAASAARHARESAINEALAELTTTEG
jgi:hypothetical protein